MTQKQLELDRKFYLELVNQSNTIFEYSYYSQKLKRINRMLKSINQSKKTGDKKTWRN